MSVIPAARQSSTSLATSPLTIVWTGPSPAQYSAVLYSTVQYCAVLYCTVQYSTSLVTSLLTILLTGLSYHVTITIWPWPGIHLVPTLDNISALVVCCVLVNIQLLVLSPLLISAV